MEKTRGRIASPSLVGRAPELGRLGAALDRAQEGAASVVLVSGEAGVGKTRLLAAATEEARAAGATVAIGRCMDLAGGALPFAPIVEALRELLAAVGGDRDSVVGAARGDLGRLVADLRVPGEEGVDVGGMDGTARTRLFTSILQVVERASERAPIVLALEDLHWADDSTRDLLTFLIHGLGGRVLLVATLRSDELHRRHPLRPWLASMSRHDHVRRLDLRSLTRDEVAAQVGAILGEPPDEELVGRVFARSEGNPLFVEELVGTGFEGESSRLPATLQELLSARIAFLPDETQEILRVAAAAGPRADHRLLAAVAGLPQEEIAGALRGAVAHNVLVPDSDGTYVFRHPLLREVAYDDLLPGERAPIHAALARALTEHPELAGDHAAAQVAQHWYEAHDLPKSLAVSVRAGLASEQVFAFPEALRHFERALDLWDQVPDASDLAEIDRGRLMERAAHAANLAGDPGRAIALLRAALDDQAFDSPSDRALVHHYLGRYLQWGIGNDDDARREFETAVALLEDQPPSEVKARVISEAAFNLFLVEPARAALVAEEALEVARDAGARAAEGFALNVRGQGRMAWGHLEDAISDLEGAAAIAWEVGAHVDLGRAFIGHGEALYLAGRAREAISRALEGAATMESLGCPGERDFLLGNVTEYSVPLGEWDDVQRMTERAVRGGGPWSKRLGALKARAEVALRRGDLDEGRRCVEEGRPLLEGVRQPQYRTMWNQVEARLALMENDLDRAADRAAEAVEAASGVSVVETTRACLLSLQIAATRAERARGRASEDVIATQEDLAGELIRHVEQFPGQSYPEAAAGYLQMRAEKSRIGGNRDPSSWSEAARQWELLSYPHHEAYARLREAEAHLYARSDRAAASGPLRVAHVLAMSLGALPLVEEIEVLAQRGRIELTPPESGASEPPSSATEPERAGLTPRELEVLKLVVVGATNREIATELFISDKTASVHVSHILSKLGARSRVEAAAFAHQLGLVATETNTAVEPG